MSSKPTHHTGNSTAADDGSSELSDEQTNQLQDAVEQRRLEREYRLQLRRRLCPGCGETDDIPF